MVYRCLLASDSSEAVDTAGEARILVQSMFSFSLNAWRISGSKRSSIASKDMRAD